MRSTARRLSVAEQTKSSSSDSDSESEIDPLMPLMAHIRQHNLKMVFSRPVDTMGN